VLLRVHLLSSVSSSVETELASPRPPVFEAFLGPLNREHLAGVELRPKKKLEGTQEGEDLANSVLTRLRGREEMQRANRHEEQALNERDRTQSPGRGAERNLKTSFEAG